MMSHPVQFNDRYTPRITVAAVVEHDQKFLIIEEWVNNQLVFNQPAGHLEPGEDLLQAVIRETLEESGCVIEPIHLINTYHTDIDQPENTKLRFNFAARLCAQHHDAQLDSGIVAAHWLTLAQLHQQQHRMRSPAVLKCVEDYLSGLQLPLTSVINVSI